MNRQSWCAILVALALAAPVQAQNEPSLELAPLVPPKAPWLRKNQKKKHLKKKAPPAQMDVQSGAPFVAAPPSTLPSLPVPEAAKAPDKTAPAVAQPPKSVEMQLPLPPLVPPPPAAIAVSSLGVVLQNDGLDAASAANVEQGLRGVVKIAPLTRAGPVLAKTAQPCIDDVCLSVQAALLSIDQLLVASYTRSTLSVRLVDVAGKRKLSEAKQDAVGAGEAAASAEALACKLLVPAGCVGEVAADATEGVQLELDGKPLARGEKQKIPVGVHQLSARAGGKVAQRSLPVSLEGAPSLYARVVDGQPRILTAAEMVPPAVVAVEAPRAPASKARWSKPVGYAALGIGAAVGAAGAIFGAMSHSDLNKAESAFRANGGAYRAGDLETLSSGNSKAHSANALFVASGVLLAAGAVFTLAF